MGKNGAKSLGKRSCPPRRAWTICTQQSPRIHNGFQGNYWLDAATELTEDDLRELRRRLKAGQAIVLRPNTNYRVGDVVYSTDSRGRLATARYRINQGSVKPTNSPRTASSKDTSVIGNLPLALSNDIGFHLLGDQFYGSKYYPNLVPGDDNLNVGAFATLEGLWKKAAREGKTVDVDITLIYGTNDLRPEVFQIHFTIGDREFSINLRNTSGQKVGENVKEAIRQAIDAAGG
jgi:hypothetical protein